MSDLRIQSVGSPFDDTEIARLGVSVVMRADAMGLLAPRAIRRLDLAEWQRVVRDVVEGGVGMGNLAGHAGATPPAGRPAARWPVRTPGPHRMGREG